MKTRTRRPRMPVLTALLVLAGCASAGSEPMDETTVDAATVEPDAGAVTVVVDNNAVPPTTLTVYLVPNNGVREMLGTVTANEQETFLYEGELISGQYRLVGTATGGADIVSRDFTLVDEDATIEWDLSTNTVQVGGGSE